MKRLLLATTVAFGLMGGSAFAQIVINSEAEKVMGNGEILSVEVLSYYEYKMLVRYKKKIYHCFSEKMFRENMAGLYHHCTYQSYPIYKDDK